MICRLKEKLMANDKDIKDYLHRKIVPPGFRPQSDEDIEKALDMFDGPMDSDTVAEILDKASGAKPLNYEMVEPKANTLEESVESNELLALHRAADDSESDDVKEKLDKYRQQAKDDDEVENESEDDVD
jgi:hypothetical protein